MRILLTNDDGYDASGIQILARVLRERGHDIYIVAPHRERSAASHSITLTEPLRVYTKKENEYAVTGTPVDCVMIASEVILKNKVEIDVVISGINSGPNMGDDVLYSGTVAAAIEAMCMEMKAIAISLGSFTDQKFETAAIIMANLLDSKVIDIIRKNEILNINVPNCLLNEIKGIRVTKVGKRRYHNFVCHMNDHRGRDIFWIGGDGPVWEKEIGTDQEALSEGYVSITPLALSFTNEEAMKYTENWITSKKVQTTLTKSDL